ncbi:MAG: hypothetical protein BroJett030_32130 [Alphaproteobacteria bacterium]|nr:MAG: hypothetical protein BroJett030_32130 [Alphaproteobacteria bacterium]
MGVGAGTDLSELGPDCYSLHRADGRARYVNANANRLFGRAGRTLLDGGFVAMIDAGDRAGFLDALRGCLDGQAETRARFHLAGAAAPGRWRWFEVTCRSAGGLADDDGVPLVLAVTRDVSERYAFEQDLRQAREKAEELNLAKSRFLANMSHELRTPLNAILGFSELLQAEMLKPLPPERQREYVGLIHGSAKHLLNVLNDILDMSKIEAGKYEILAEPFSLANALNACCAMMRGQAETRGIELVAGDFADLPEVVADERAVKQIVINLLSNALKFTDRGGRVEVTARRTARHVRICVADNGIGISPEHMDGLGRPFYQADSKYDRKYEGTGLGLSVVRGLCDLHGGKVEFASRKDAGTTVTVTLPITSRQPRPVPAGDEIEIVRLAPPERQQAPFAIARRAG